MSSEALGKLRAVNVPDISESDFSRLYKGKLANIIDLVAQSVVGRREANIARATIQRLVVSVQFAMTRLSEHSVSEIGIFPIAPNVLLTLFRTPCTIVPSEPNHG